LIVHLLRLHGDNEELSFIIFFTVSMGEDKMGGKKQSKKAEQRAKIRKVLQ